MRNLDGGLRIFLGPYHFNRLMAASFGETCLLHEHWEMAKEMELLRKDRLNKCTNT
ncbi:putative mini-chromosome maintenance complex-binding protein [Helianthus anomalus]